MAGRPSDLDRIIAHDRDTEAPITVADSIVNALRIGSYLEPAIAQAGSNKITVYGWLKVAGKAKLRTQGGTTNTDTLTDHEKRCIAFSDAVERASAEWELGTLGRLETLARGGMLKEIITEKVNTAGEVIERTTRTEKLLPDAAVMQWRLTRRFQSRYSERVEVVEPDMPTLDDDEAARALAEQLQAYLQGLADAAAEAETAPTAETPKRRARPMPAQVPAE